MASICEHEEYICAAFGRKLNGKHLWFFTAKIEENEVDDHYDLQNMVAKMGKTFEEFKVNGIIVKDVFQLFNDFAKLIQRDDMDTYFSTSSRHGQLLVVL